jgi:hypothetical protein
VGTGAGGVAAVFALSAASNRRHHLLSRVDVLWRHRLVVVMFACPRNLGSVLLAVRAAFTVALNDPVS